MAYGAGKLRDKTDLKTVGVCGVGARYNRETTERKQATGTVGKNI